MADLYEEIVDAMNALHGRHAGHRAAHAKGTVCRAGFVASPAAAELSTAAHLQGAETPVTVRFSNGSGNPHAPDNDRREGRGLAVKFHLPGEQDEATDIVALTLPVFFVRDADSFLEFLRAREPDPESGEMDMERLGAFLGEHPETGAALQQILPTLSPPASFANCRFNGLHSFAFVNAEGERRFGRYSFLPEAGEELMPEEEIDAATEHYLQEEIGGRLASGPVAYTLVAALAGDGDAVDDPTVAWPEDRETVGLGRLEITETAADVETPETPLIFDPNNLTEGIEASGDKILAARSKAYSVSIERRLAASNLG